MKKVFFSPFEAMKKVLFFSLLIGMIGLVSCGKRGLDNDSIPITPVGME